MENVFVQKILKLFWS